MYVRMYGLSTHIHMFCTGSKDSRCAGISVHCTIVFY